jgi:O-antigen ligase
VIASLWWPSQMLVVAALSPLADPYVIRAVTGAATGHSAWYSGDLVLLLIGLPIAIRALLRGELLPALRHPATPFFVAYTAVAVISALVNRVPPVVAAAGIGVTLDGIAIFYLVRMIGPDERFLKRVIAIFVGIMVFAGLLAIGQVVLAPDLLGFRAFAGDFGEGGRATAFLGNPNQLAPLLALAMPFPLLALPDAQRRRDRVLLLLVGLILAIAFWLTFSRAAWTAFVLALALVAARFNRRGLAIAVTIGILALATAMALPRNLAVQGDPKYASLQDPDVVDATIGRLGAIGAGNDLRVIFLQEGLPIAAENPVVGVGPGRYGGAAANVFGTPVYARYGISLHGFHTVHDYWLHLLVEVGVLGAGAVLVAIVLVARGLWRAVPRLTGSSRTIVLAVSIGLIAFSINSLAEMLLEGNTPSFVLWLLVGLGSLLADRALSEPA